MHCIQFLTNRSAGGLTCSLLHLAVSAIFCKAVRLTWQQQSVYTTSSSNSTPAQVYNNGTQAYYRPGTEVTVSCRKGFTGLARATCTKMGAFGVFMPPHPFPTCEAGKESAPLSCYGLSERKPCTPPSNLTMNTIQVCLLQSGEPNRVQILPY